MDDDDYGKFRIEKVKGFRIKKIILLFKLLLLFRLIHESDFVVSFDNKLHVALFHVFIQELFITKMSRFLEFYKVVILILRKYTNTQHNMQNKCV